jgi:AcrR family transcriptional regulator
MTIAEAPPTRKRLPGPEREQAIVEEAVRFFADVGFQGDTRQLAKRLGVTQSLMYKYFPNKAALIDRVYEEVYLGRWNPFWEAVIRDRSIPLEDRLVQLYVEYAKAALTRDWVRIFMFSGLRGESINRRYLDVLRTRILEPVAEELRHELGLPAVTEVPLSTAEIELVWSINARIFYFGQRRWIFDVPIEAPLEDMIELTIRHFMAGARAVLPEMVRPSVPEAAKTAKSVKAARSRRRETTSSGDQSITLK